MSVFFPSTAAPFAQSTPKLAIRAVDNAEAMVRSPKNRQTRNNRKLFHGSKPLAIHPPTGPTPLTEHITLHGVGWFAVHVWAWGARHRKRQMHAPLYGKHTSKQ